jgi:hypothetical protein
MRIQHLPGMFVLLAWSALAHAQTPTKESNIERILTLTKADAMTDQMFDQIKALTESQIPPDATAEEQAKSRKIQGQVMDLVKARMSWDIMRPLYVKLYGEIFSEGEIEGLLAFYQSPAGRAMIQKMPVLIAKMMALAQDRMKDISPEIERILREARKE